MMRLLFIILFAVLPCGLLVPAAVAGPAPEPPGEVSSVSTTDVTDQPAESGPHRGTLLLKGSLEGTPPVAAACRPFTFRFRVQTAGSAPPTNGSLKLEVRSADQKQPVYARQLPFALGAGTHMIERLDMTRGVYRVTLRASAVFRQRTRIADVLLAEQLLTVTGPVDVKRSSVSIPRVLIWSSVEDSTVIERAIIDKLLKEAFESESIHVKIVANAGDFTSFALTGQYNVYLLLEVDGAPDAAEALRYGLAKGYGIMLAGSGERMQALAEALDFRFGSPLRGSRGIITFPDDSGLGLSGTLPVSGRILLPRKQGARAVATFPDGQPAILVDVRDKGKVIVMPFSLVKSALNAGTTDLYSLVLRSSVLTVAPEPEAPGSIASMQLLVSATSGGQERTRITETLPPGAKVLWTSIPPSAKDGTLTFELTAEDEPKKVLYLFQPAEPGGTKTSSEVFMECGGKFVSQGKVE